VKGAELCLSNFLWRHPSDKIIMPFINDLRDKDVCEPGCGEGAYTKALLENGNRVTGIDRNPGLCGVNIQVVDADAADYSGALMGRKFDVVFSAWLTEYLDEKAVTLFLLESYNVLKRGGTFAFTVVRDAGWGALYVCLAGAVRGVKKYAYGREFILEALKTGGFTGIRAEALNSWCRVPWADFYTANKPC